MAEFSYTAEQEAVIKTRDANLLVSAAAGSGKTAVLSARIISLLTDPEKPVDIDRMLIVTFTKAAAAEMRERIGKAIRDYSASHPEDMRMDRQGALLHAAKITTIDSFCLFVVKNHFAQIGLDPGFRTLEAGERELLLQDALDEVLEEEYGKEEAEFVSLMDAYSRDGRDEPVRQLILQLYNYALSDPEPEKWLESMGRDRASAPEDIISSKWYGFLKSRADRLLQRVRDLAEKAMDLIGQPGGPSGYMDQAAELKTAAELMLSHQDHDGRCHVAQATVFSRLKPVKKNEDKELAEEAKGYLQAAKDTFKKAGGYYMADGAELLRQQQLIDTHSRKLCSLALELHEVFQKSKQEKGALDFSDMEHYALDILLREEGGKLIPTEAALELRDYFECIFVDEYQDSNYVQERVLTSIAREDNMFMVGDVKQSIYRFRLARPEIFLGKYERYSESGRDRRIDLNKNFRSRREVLDFANGIFEHIMKKDTGEMDYDAKAALYYGASFYPEAVDSEYLPEILVADASSVDLLSDEEAGDGDEETGGGAQDGGLGDAAAGRNTKKPGKADLECLMVAQRIRELVRGHFPVWDTEQKVLRPVMYKDIVILARSTTSYEAALKEAFAALDIPLYIGSRAGYYNAREVRQVLNVLRTVDDPGQDIPLYDCLTSYLELYDEDELAELRSRHPVGSLYKALLSEESEKAKIFLDWLEKMGRAAEYMHVRELLERIYDRDHFLDRQRAMPMGERRIANLLLLLEKAGDFEKTSYHGLFSFLRYVEQLKSQEMDEGEAGTADENADVVRVMTIHKSKGLEFPVCICLGFYKKFNQNELKADCLMDMNMGLGLDAVDPILRYKMPGLKKKAMKEMIRQAALAEEMRVLYVALTRAREKLILTDVREKVTMEEPPAPDAWEVLNAGNIMEWIRMALAAEGLDGAYEKVVKADTFLDRAAEDLATGAVSLEALYADDLPVSATIQKELALCRERQYAHPELRGLYTKTSVSELKKAAYEDEEERSFFPEQEERYVPAFVRHTEEMGLRSGEEPSDLPAADKSRETGEQIRRATGGALRGTAIHRFMELLEYKNLSEEMDEAALQQALQAQAEAFCADGRLPKEYYELLRIRDILPFFRGEMAQRVRKAAGDGKLHRESPFFMGVPASEMDPSFPEKESIVVQGIIDAWLEEEDGLTVIDYKTDRVREPEELIRRYHTQLEIYARALQQLRDKKVKEKMIYSFALAQWIRV